MQLFTMNFPTRKAQAIATVDSVLNAVPKHDPKFSQVKGYIRVYLDKKTYSRDLRKGVNQILAYYGLKMIGTRLFVPNSHPAILERIGDTEPPFHNLLKHHPAAVIRRVSLCVAGVTYRGTLLDATQLI